MSTTDPLLQPFQLGHLTLRNRLMSTAHACGLGQDGMPDSRYQAYHEEKARGGIGLTMFGGSSNVSVDSPNMMPQLNVGVDSVIPYLERMAQRTHAHGAAVMMQITHLGRRGEFDGDAHLPMIAPTAIRETLHRAIPKEMDSHDIARVIADFAAATKRCKDAGLDGIEVLAGGHLLGQFLSPVMNHRTDSYGGSVENRSRFGIELYEAMRHAVGSDFALGIRLIIDEAQDGGIDFEDGIALARQFQQGGCVDFFNAIYGRMDTVLALAEDNMPGMASPDAPFLMRAGQFKAAVQLPVFHAARIADVATARYAIKEGLLDLVGMTRAHIAEPYIAAKIANGIEDRIRPCVGATHCMGKNRPSCIHNPATGREAQLRHVIDPSPTPRRVVIIGAGPAGLEAARVCGARGHDVTVLEAAPHPGGQVLLAARASWRRSLTGIIDWRIAELAHLGVQIRCNVLAEEDDITALAPDLIIVATGGIPNSGGLPGEEHITSPWDILDGTVPPEGDVLVVDGTGRHVALSVAERVLTSGSRLQMAVIDDTLAAEQGYAEKVIWRKWARLKGIRPLFEEALIGVRRDGNALIATLRSELTGSDTDIRCAQVIWDYGTRPMDALFHGLRMQSRNEGVTDQSAMVAGQPQPRGQYNGFELHRIGDAVASRNIHAAILDALRLCQHC